VYLPAPVVEKDATGNDYWIIVHAKRDAQTVINTQFQAMAKLYPAFRLCMYLNMIGGRIEEGVGPTR
jgi:hypothetical protein